MITSCKNCKWRKSVILSDLFKKFPSSYMLCNNNVKRFLLLLRKGVYPYEYISSILNFNEKELPAIDSFYSNLSSSGISKADYAHALKKVWNVFKINNISEYHDLYVKCDVAQLSGVFESFRDICLKQYGLDTSYFISTPGFAFEAMLKCTKVKLQLLTDIDMVLMVEKGIRGGLTQVVKRHAIANNRYVKGYDANKKSVFLQYLDFNNLYGYGMNKKLPLYGFKWSDINMFTVDFIKNYDDEVDKGYLLDVDIEYPKELINLHSDIPINIEECSTSIKKRVNSAHRKVYKTFNIVHEPENKLISTVQDKNNYVCNISTLKLALDHGLRL